MRGILNLYGIQESLYFLLRPDNEKFSSSINCYLRVLRLLKKKLRLFHINFKSVCPLYHIYRTLPNFFSFLVQDFTNFVSKKLLGRILSKNSVHLYEILELLDGF